MAAFMLPVMVGAMGLGAEISYRYQQQRKIQHAADLGAHAAAIRYAAGDSSGTYQSVGETIAGQASWDSGIGTATWNSPPSQGAFTGGTGPNGGDVVELILTEDQPRLLSSMYSSGTITLEARAVAEVQTGREACVLSLAPTASGATSIGGNSSLNLTACDIASNSNASDAFLQFGNANLTTDCIFVVGQAVTTSNLTLNDCSTPKENQAVIADPYAAVAQPTVEGPCVDWSAVSGSPIITPTWLHSSGVMSTRFCGSDVSLKSSYTFLPGLYILDGVDLTANAKGVMTGTDLTIFVTNGARLRINGQGQLNLKARTSDPWSGIVFFGDRTDTTASHKINGGSSAVIQGAVYFPVADLTFNGGSDVADACTQVIAYTVSFSGNNNLEIDCSAAGTSEIATAAFIGLVE